MPTPILSRLSPEAFRDPNDFKQLAANVSEKIKTECPGVVWKNSYATLGRFDDPVLNTMVHWDDELLAGVIFHELTHQRLYVKGDSDFSEALATVVEEEGVRRWLGSIGKPETLTTYLARQERRVAFGLLMGRGRERLRELYNAPEFADYMLEDKRAAKRKAFDRLRFDYEILKESWGGYSNFDPWFDRDLNNAHLVSISTYSKWVPALRSLLRREENDLDRFFVAADKLAALDKDERDMTLRELGAVAAETPTAK